MKKYLVITSIFPPTEAVQKFAKISDWQLVVVGDKKTPDDWQLDDVVYLSPEAQQKLGYKIVDELPWNHYCRKMVGYLYAMSQGAELIADSDDDNIPNDDWPALPEAKTYSVLSEAKFANIYKYFTDKPVWPRGYPLNYLLAKDEPSQSDQAVEVGVWQFLANEDPDVDAIYRLTNDTPIDFDNNKPRVMDKGTVCPFNSQNTVFHQKFFPLLYLPSFVTFRFTDILRGLVAQPLLWEQGARLGFGPATVIQKRNPHNYLKDFESEIPVYLYSEQVVDIVTQCTQTSSDKSLPALLKNAYQKLLENSIATEAEVSLLNAWLQDLEAVRGN